MHLRHTRALSICAVGLVWLAAGQAMAAVHPRTQAAASSTLTAGWEPQNVIDGNYDSSWSSVRCWDGGGSCYEWVAFWFDAFRATEYVRIVPRTYTEPGTGLKHVMNMPASVNIYYSGTNGQWNYITSVALPANQDDVPHSGQLISFPSVYANGILLTTSQLRPDLWGGYYFQVADLYAGDSTPTGPPNPCTAANPHDEAPDGSALQACLDQGGRITLTPDAQPGYLIDRPLFITVPNTELTTTTGSGHAVLRATLALFNNRYTRYGHNNNSYNNSMLMGLQSASPYYVNHIQIDGLKDVEGVWRDVNETDMQKSGWPVNATLRGQFVVDSVISQYTFLGAAMQVLGRSFEVRNSVFRWSGQPNSFANGDYVGDGLTVLDCRGGGRVHDNLVAENTDVGLVVGGGDGSGCLIENNRIENNYTHGIAGLQVGYFTPHEGNGNHTNITYRGNIVVSAYNMLSFGIIVGDTPWYGPFARPNVTNAGTVTGNVALGAVVGLAVAGIGAGTVVGNAAWGSRGTWNYPGDANGCSGSSWSTDYAAFDWGTAFIEPGYRPWYFEQSNGCGVWNTSTPMPDPNDPGVLLADESIGPDQNVDSQDGRFHLRYQGDGNLVLYDENWTGLWASMRFSASPICLYMQADGNLITRDASGDTWDSGTGGNTGAYLVVQNDGNVVIYDRYHNPLSWRYLWTW